jgi:hypothetical protein
MADDGDEITMRPRLDAQHAEATLGIVERHPFDGAGEHRAVRLGGGSGAGMGATIVPVRSGCGERERTKDLRPLTGEQIPPLAQEADAVARVAAHRGDAN